MHAPATDTGRADAFVWLLPLVFLITGSAIRFLAFRFAIPDADPSAYFDQMCRWDCQWYVHMAQAGYDPFPVPGMITAGNWAFFPAYPMLVGLIAKLVPLPTIVVASLVSLAVAYAAVVVAWPLLGRSRRSYALYAAFVLSGPLSIYFTTFFTEVLFILLAALVFRFLGRSNYLGASLATAALSATRIVGVFATLSIALQAVLDHWRRTGSWRGLLRGLLGQPNLVLAIFFAPVGLFAYMAYLYGLVGDGLAFSHVQRAWGRQVGNPFFYLWQGLTTTQDGQWLAPSQILALAALAGLGLTIVLMLRRQWPAALFCAICIILPLAAGLASMVRFMAGMAPLTITLATLLGRHRLVFWLSLLGLLIGAWFTTIAWLGGNIALV